MQGRAHTLQHSMRAMPLVRVSKSAVVAEACQAALPLARGACCGATHVHVSIWPHRRRAERGRTPRLSPLQSLRHERWRRCVICTDPIVKFFAEEAPSCDFCHLELLAIAAHIHCRVHGAGNSIAARQLLWHERLCHGTLPIRNHQLARPLRKAIRIRMPGATHNHPSTDALEHRTYT